MCSNLECNWKIWLICHVSTNLQGPRNISSYNFQDSPSCPVCVPGKTFPQRIQTENLPITRIYAVVKCFGILVLSFPFSYFSNIQAQQLADRSIESLQGSWLWEAKSFEWEESLHFTTNPFKMFCLSFLTTSMY